MSEHFYPTDGMRSIKKLAQIKGDLLSAFVDFDKKVFAEGALPVKLKELIAIGAAHITRCPYCIDAHVQRAQKAGATEEEIAEAIFVAVAMSAGASVAHSCIAVDSMSK